MNTFTIIVVVVFSIMTLALIYSFIKLIKEVTKEDENKEQDKTPLEIETEAIKSGIKTEDYVKDDSADDFAIDGLKEILPVPMVNEEAKRYVDKHAECWPVGFDAERFQCGKQFSKIYQMIGLSVLCKVPEIVDDAKDIPYEEIENAFWNKCDEIDNLITDEHNNLHCPKGQHVWVTGYHQKTCEVCNSKNSLYETIHKDEISCNLCFPYNEPPTIEETRENKLRRLLWLGQKAGHIAPPLKKDSPMGFLWNRKK